MAQIQTKFIADLAITNAKIANTTINLTTKVTGILPVANGGTGANTLTANNIILGNGTSAVSFVAPGTSGNVLTSNGTTWTSAAAVDTGITQLTGDVTAGPGSGSQAATIANNVVTNAKLAQMATLTIKGNNTGGTANAIDLTVAQVNAILPVFTSTLNGLAPLSGGGTTNFLRADGTWAAPSFSAVTTVGSFNSQASSANGLVISGSSIFAQAATVTNPGMVIVPAAGGLALSTASLSINVDASTVSINGSNQLQSIQPNEEQFTLSGTDITNQFVDLAHVIFGSSASVNSAGVYVVGGPEQQKTVDYTVSLTGGAGGVTRISFAGDLATGGAAALIAGDVLVVDYSFLA